MSIERAKIFFMGKPLEHEELPEPEPSLEAYFPPVALTGRAIDLASQIVPHEHWITTGIHTWLQKRADEAYKRMTMDKREIILGKLKYHFEIKADVPTLQKVSLH